MIYCITKAKEGYAVNYSGLSVGPWAKYKNEPAVFAALSFMSPLLYQWELGSPVPEMERLIAPERSVEGQLRGTLCLPLGSSGTFHKILLTARDPKDVRDKLFIALDKHKPSLPIYDTYSESQLRMIVDARVASWARMFTPSVAMLAWATTKSEWEQIVKENAYGRFKVH